MSDFVRGASNRYLFGGGMVKAMYQIKMHRNKNGENGRLIYGFSTKLKACIFAAGFQAALWDCGKTDLFLSVWDNGDYLKQGVQGYKHKHTLVMDSEQLKEIAEREF